MIESAIRQLNRVYQKDYWGCAIACAATILNLSYEEVKTRALELFGDSIVGVGLYKHQELQLYKSYDFTGFQFLREKDDGTFGFIDNRTYLATVPAQYNLFGSHRVIIQVVDSINIYDPILKGAWEMVDLTQQSALLKDVWEVCFGD